MSISKTSFTAFPPVAGILMIISAAQYLLFEAITAAAWAGPEYSYTRNFISDLGNPIPNDIFNGMVVNSPFHPLMNLAFITQGILFMAATFLLWRKMPGRIGKTLLALGVAHGIGIILVGTFHENTTVPMIMRVPHFLGAWAAIFGGNLIAIIVGLAAGRVSAGPAYRIASVLMSVAGIGAFTWLLADPAMMATHGGLLERIAVYTVVAWQSLTGILLLLANTKHRGTFQNSLAKNAE